jgi:hypothetical protein
MGYPALDSRTMGGGNTLKKARSIKATAANFKSYPANFRLTEITSNWEDLTTNAFYVSNKTVWAKQ